jgi:hypothetical protein
MLRNRFLLGEIDFRDYSQSVMVLLILQREWLKASFSRCNDFKKSSEAQNSKNWRVQEESGFLRKLPSSNCGGCLEGPGFRTQVEYGLLVERGFFRLSPLGDSHNQSEWSRAKKEALIAKRFDLISSLASRSAGNRALRDGRHN